MARYVINSADTTIVANATLVIVRAATAWSSAGSLLSIIEARVAQHGTATSQNLGILVGQKASAFGTYTAATPAPLDIGGPASAITGGTAGAAGTAGVDASAEGAGTVTTTMHDAFNNLNGWLWVPVPEARPRVGPDLAFIVKLVGTPTSLTSWDISLTYEELG